MFFNPWLIWSLQYDEKKLRRWLKPWYMGTILKVLSKSYPMSTNMVGFRWFSKIFVHYAFDESILSIGRVKQMKLKNWVLNK